MLHGIGDIRTRYRLAGAARDAAMEIPPVLEAQPAKPNTA